MLSIRSFLVVVLFFVAQLSAAQFSILGKTTLSATYSNKEPTSSKILSLDNGGAALIESSALLLYGNDFRLKVKKNLSDMPDYIIETGDNVTLLGLSDGYDKKEMFSSVYQIVVNKNSGEILEERTLFEHRMSIKDAKAAFKSGAFNGSFSSSSIRVRKDAEGNYAVAIIPFETTKDFQVLHFNAKSKEISRASFPVEQGWIYGGMAVVGDKELMVLASGEKGLCAGVLKSGNNTLSVQPLKYTPLGKIEKVEIKYNPKADVFNFLTLELTNDKNYESQVGKIYRDSLVVKKQKIDIAPLSEIAQRDYIRKKGFPGVPDNLYVKDDGGVVVTFEENSTYQSGSTWIGSSTPSASAQSQYTYYTYGDVGVVDFDKSGKLKGATYIPKKHTVTNGIPGLGEEPASTYWARGFKSYIYINAEPQGYVLFNDLEENRQKIVAQKEIKAVGSYVSIGADSDCFAFKTGGRDIPEGRKVFQEPNRVGLFLGADYNKKTKTLVTITRKGDEDKTARLVWVKID